MNLHLFFIKDFKEFYKRNSKNRVVPFLLLYEFYRSILKPMRRKEIKILDYQSEHQPYFEQLNRNWIEKYFRLEPIDKFVLMEPEKAILQKGGAILMVTFNNEIAG